MSCIIKTRAPIKVPKPFKLNQQDFPVLMSGEQNSKNTPAIQPQLRPEVSHLSNQSNQVNQAQPAIKQTVDGQKNIQMEKLKIQDINQVQRNALMKNAQKNSMYSSGEVETTNTNQSDSSNLDEAEQRVDQVSQPSKKKKSRKSFSTNNNPASDGHENHTRRNSVQNPQMGTNQDENLGPKTKQPYRESERDGPPETESNTQRTRQIDRQKIIIGMPIMGNSFLRGSGQQNTLNLLNQVIHQPFIIRNFFKQIKNKHLFQKPHQGYNYSLKPQGLFPERKRAKTWFRKVHQIQLEFLRLISINCDTMSTDKQSSKKRYIEPSDEKRQNELIFYILYFMEQGVDFIALQEVFSVRFRTKLLNMFKQFNIRGGCTYFYPQNLQEETENMNTTMILSKHQVEFGQLKFDIRDGHDSDGNIIATSQQAYCEFQIKLGEEIQKMCIMSCHLRSNRYSMTLKSPQKVRDQQLIDIEHFSRSYHRFILIGDTNIPSSFGSKAENERMDMKFTDGLKLGKSKQRGTYLHMKQNGSVVEERLDRIVVDKRSAQRTLVEINYHDKLLSTCQKLGLDRVQAFKRTQDQYLYLTLTDHTILDAKIRYKK